MIVKCYTCGAVLGDKFQQYKMEVSARKINKTLPGLNSKAAEIATINEVQYWTPGNNEKSEEGKVLDEMGITKTCCRTRLLTYCQPI